MKMLKNNNIRMWLIVAIVSGAIDVLTSNSFFILFSIGSIVAAVCAGFGISLAVSSAAQVVGWAIGAGIGAIGGTLDAVIYSNDKQDYSQFADRVKDGVVTGIRAASFGMAIGSYMNYYHRLAEKIRIQNYFDKHGRIAPPDDPSAKSLMDLDYETTFI
jgi:hypothetical protein